MLSMPGTLLFLIDCIATSVSNLCGRSFSSSVLFLFVCVLSGDRGSTVVKVPCYKFEGRWFDPS